MKIYLDLLPKEKKSELRRKKTFRTILREEFLFLLPILLFIIILSNIYYLLSIQRGTLNEAKLVAESQDKYQELSSYEDKFKQVNDVSSKLLKIQSSHLHWSEILDKIGTTMPETISITDLSTKDFKVFLVGKSKSRDILLDFKGNLEKDSCFADVNVPLSNLVVKDNIDFQMDFSINQDCIKKQ